MENIYLQCDDLTIKKNNRIFLNSFDFKLKKGRSVCILGESGCGKSLLLKEFCKKRKCITINGKFESYFLDKSKDTDWKKELNYNENKKYQKLLKSLFKNEKKIDYKIALMKKVLTKPEFMIIDDLSSILTSDEQGKLFSFLKKLDITIIYATNKIEDTLNFEYTMVIKNQMVAIEGSTLAVMKEEKLMKLLGYSIPFYINLSLQLKLYGILNHICLTKEELEKCIWHLK